MTSKFAAVLAAKNDVQEDETTKTSPTQKKVGKSNPMPKQVIHVQHTQSEPRRIGRPNAKRSDPDYVQTTTYIKKTTHRDVKRALLDDENERDFSELVEELLAKWLRSKL